MKKDKTNNERLIAVFESKIRETVERILEEKLRLDPHCLDEIGAVGKRRVSFWKRSIKK